MKESLKSVYVCQSYHKRRSWCFLTHDAVKYTEFDITERNPVATTYNSIRILHFSFQTFLLVVGFCADEDLSKCVTALRLGSTLCYVTLNEIACLSQSTTMTSSR